jgi:L-lactate dehydrogenase complex protein LldG
MSKEKILSNITKHMPGHTDIPDIPMFARDGIDLYDAFQEIVIAGGGLVFKIDESHTIESIVRAQYPDAQSIVSNVPGMSGNIDLSKITVASDLKTVDVAIVNGQIGVAENGAVWVTEKDCIIRVLPFITQHLFVLISKESLVWNMHQAYDTLNIDQTGFGVFIAGPSKTADIEQSLVIGAQGARSFTVLVH